LATVDPQTGLHCGARGDLRQVKNLQGWKRFAAEADFPVYYLLPTAREVLSLLWRVYSGTGNKRFFWASDPQNIPLVPEKLAAQSRKRQKPRAYSQRSYRAGIAQLLDLGLIRCTYRRSRQPRRFALTFDGANARIVWKEAARRLPESCRDSAAILPPSREEQTAPNPQPEGKLAENPAAIRGPTSYDLRPTGEEDSNSLRGGAAAVVLPSHEGQGEKQKTEPQRRPRKRFKLPIEDPSTEAKCRELCRRLRAVDPANARIYGAVNLALKRGADPRTVGDALTETVKQAEAGELEFPVPYALALIADWDGLPSFSDDYEPETLSPSRAEAPSRVAPAWDPLAELEQIANRLTATNRAEREREQEAQRQRIAEREREAAERRAERERLETEARTYRERRDAGKPVEPVAELAEDLAELVSYQDAQTERERKAREAEEKRKRRERLDAELRPYELQANDLAKGNPERIRAVRAIVYPNSDGNRTEDSGAIVALGALVESWGATVAVS